MSISSKSADPLDTSLPAVRKLQDYIRDKRPVELKLMSGDTLTGQIIWQDPEGLMIKAEGDAEFLVWRHGIAYCKVL
jgi:host factor-I protein